MVPTVGVEPTILAEHGPEPCASANSATSASINPRKPFPVCALNNIAQVLHFASASRLFLSDFGQTHRKSNKKMARETGLEPATSTVTGWHSNQLSYSPAYISGVDAWKNSVSLSTLYNITPFGCFANVFFEKK